MQTLFFYSIESHLESVIVQNSIPEIPGHGSKILAVFLGDLWFLAYIKMFSSLGAEMAKNKGTDRQMDKRTISIEHIALIKKRKQREKYVWAKLKIF
jgi:hypothetical protein